MKILPATLLPLALALGACDTMTTDPYDPDGYPPAPYPEQQPYPPEPYPPQGYPPAPPIYAMPAAPLDRTRWTVVAINKRPTPRDGDYSMEFDAGRLSAKFGCNGIGAGYTQTGATLDAGAIIATRMACPDMSWENQGTAVLNQVMQVNTLAPNRITLTSSAGSIELLRR